MQTQMPAAFARHSFIFYRRGNVYSIFDALVGIFTCVGACCARILVRLRPLMRQAHIGRRGQESAATHSLEAGRVKPVSRDVHKKNRANARF